MNSPQFKSFGFLIFLALLVSACLTQPERDADGNRLGPDVNTNFNANASNSNSNEPEDDEIALNSLINLPFDPVENVWRQEKPAPDTNSNSVPRPKGDVLTAVLKFSETDTNSLVAGYDKPPFETELEAEDWFPAELIAKGETSGDQTLKGKAYGVERFLKPPYKSGSLIRISETDYFVLILHTQ